MGNLLDIQTQLCSFGTSTAAKLANGNQAHKFDCMYAAEVPNKNFLKKVPKQINVTIAIDFGNVKYQKNQHSFF